MSLLRRLRNISFRRTGFILLTAWCFLDVVRFHSLRLSTPGQPPTAAPPNQKIYIASTHWNNEQILKDHWNSAVLQLVKHFGPNNTFVSIYESGSWDNSKAVLRELQTQLESIGVGHKIVLDKVTHEDEIAQSPADTGWIDTPRGRKELRRIPYLSKLRNLSLEPLQSLAQEGILFDRILFLNDVVFTLNDVLTLLETNNGHYAAACSLDFSKPPRFYDTFALRDSEGHEAIMSTWPYFRSHASRAAVKRGDYVPVSSCWNGMVFMPVGPFLGTGTPDAEKKEGEEEAGKAGGSRKLRFRAIPDTLAEKHLEGSECCLVHADNPLSATRGVFLNPNVLVSYNSSVYDMLHSPEALMGPYTIWRRVWWNRVVRWGTWVWVKEAVVRRRVGGWVKEGRGKWEKEKRREVGEVCLINEMQVLHEKGWRHV